MIRRVTLIALLLTVLISPGLAAQDEDITVNEIEEPRWEWGKQSVYFDLTNNTDFLKLITLEGQLVISDGLTECRRDYRAGAYIEPQASTVLKLDILVPGSYGKGEVRVALHDVIDTMDIILPGQEFVEKKFYFELGRPEAAAEWNNLDLALPPKVKEHPYFDNEFAYSIFAMCNEGLSKGEIAGLCNTSLQYVNSEIAQWTRQGLLSRHDDDTYSLKFPFIKAEEAQQMSALAHRAAESLSSAIASNLNGYRPFLDSLAGEGKIIKDSSAIYSGTSVLYRPYVTVAGLVLWYDLGTDFINPDEPFRAFKKDLCNTLTQEYMYMAPGQETLNGRHVYANLAFYTSTRYIFADHYFEVVCPEDFKVGGSIGKNARWGWGENIRPDFFMLDTVAARPVLDWLGSGCRSVLTEAGTELDEMGRKFGYYSPSHSLRYWFWNLVATRCVDRLIEIGALQHDGRGLYDFNIREGL